MNPMSDKPIFIVGVQRSGTTLLRLILNAHSEIAIPEEARFLTPILKKDCSDKHYSGSELRTLIQYLKNNSQFALWNFDSNAFFEDLENKDRVSVKYLIEQMFRSYCDKEGKRVWGDKSLFFGSIDILHELFPNARFIHVIRDGRDVFDSWRKMDKTKNNPAVMALDWLLKEKSINKSFAQVPEANKLTVRYEDLLEQPESTVKSLSQFLGIEYEPDMLEFYNSSQRYIGEHHSKLIFNKIDSQNALKWKTNLDQKETAIFTGIARPLLREYNYETKDINLSFSNRASLVFMLVFGLPYRAIQVLGNRIRYSNALKKGTDVKSLSVGEMPREK